VYNVGFYNVVMVNIKEVKWGKWSGFGYVRLNGCVHMLCHVDRLFNGGNNVVGSWWLFMDGFLLVTFYLLLRTSIETIYLYL
jgi:hypothetical protein